MVVCPETDVNVGDTRLHACATPHRASRAASQYRSARLTHALQACAQRSPRSPFATATKSIPPCLLPQVPTNTVHPGCLHQYHCSFFVCQKISRLAAVEPVAVRRLKWCSVSGSEPTVRTPKFSDRTESSESTVAVINNEATAAAEQLRSFRSLTELGQLQLSVLTVCVLGMRCAC